MPNLANLLQVVMIPESPSSFDGYAFPIIDKRSLADHTILRVAEPDEEDSGESHSVRVHFQIA